MKRAVEVFENSSSGAEIQRILVVFTDGPGPIPPAEESLLARQNNITTIAIGIGNTADQKELLMIANDKVDRVYRFQDFNIAHEIISILNYEISKPYIEEIDFDQIGNYILNLNETFYLKTLVVTEKGLTLCLENIEGAVDIYYSYSYETPNKVFNDGIISEGQYFLPFNASFGKSIFITIQGIGSFNNFSFLLEEGNTIPTTTEEPTVSTTESADTEEKLDSKAVITDDYLAGFEEKQKKNYTYIWMIIVGCLMVLGLIGFGCYRVRDRKNRGVYHPPQELS